MKKLLLSVFVFLTILTTSSISLQTFAQSMSFADLINLLISVGVITPDKADIARAIIGNVNSTVQSVSTSTNISINNISGEWACSSTIDMSGRTTSVVFNLIQKDGSSSYSGESLDGYLVSGTIVGNIINDTWTKGSYTSTGSGIISNDANSYTTSWKDKNGLTGKDSCVRKIQASTATSTSINFATSSVQLHSTSPSTYSTTSAISATSTSPSTVVGSSSPACSSILTRDLSYGLSGIDVVNLQKFLFSKGFTLEYNGYFGDITKSSVIKYQLANGLNPADGYVGAKTRELINMTICNIPQSSTSCVDTDGGKDYYVKGSVNLIKAGANVTETDSCMDSSKIIEYFCSEDNVITNDHSFSCPNGCSDGVCVKDAPKEVLSWQSWESAKNVLNPRITFNGNEYVPFDDDATAAKFCMLVPDRKFIGGRITQADSWVWGGKTNDSLRWTGSEWLPTATKNYVRRIECSSPIVSNPQPSIQVLSPNGGENLKEGNIVNISWKTTGMTSSQKMSITLDVPHLNSTIGTKIVDNISNTGSYSWTVKPLQPFYESEGNSTVTPNGQYKVSVVCNAGELNCPQSYNFDQSDNYFTITPRVVTKPTCTSFNYSSWGQCVGYTPDYSCACGNDSNSCACGDEDYGCGPEANESCGNDSYSCACGDETFDCICDADVGAGGTQTRTVISASPAGCVGGSPVLSQDCNPNMECTPGEMRQDPQESIDRYCSGQDLMETFIERYYYCDENGIWLPPEEIYYENVIENNSPECGYYIDDPAASFIAFQDIVKLIKLLKK